MVKFMAGALIGSLIGGAVGCWFAALVLELNADSHASRLPLVLTGSDGQPYLTRPITY